MFYLEKVICFTSFIMVADIYSRWKTFTSNNCAIYVLPENFEIKETHYWTTEHSFRILPKRYFFPIKDVDPSLLKRIFSPFKKQNV